MIVILVVRLLDMELGSFEKARKGEKIKKKLKKIQIYRIYSLR